jgi:hypothetical protein
MFEPGARHALAHAYHEQPAASQSASFVIELQVVEHP